MRNSLIVLFTSAALAVLWACANGLQHKDAQSNVSPDTTDRYKDTPASGDTELVIKPGMDVVIAFNEQVSSKQIKSIRFEPGDYAVNDTLFLPRTGGLVIIDGQGSNIKVGGQVPLFYSMPSNKKQAMEWNKTRYIIRNFGQIQGGDRGVFIGSSFNSVIENIEFTGQKTAAIDLVFCLMSTIEKVLVTNVFHDGIVLRSGLEQGSKKRMWEGAGFNNSQCNHSAIKSTRVYNRKGCTGTSFKILQSTGVRLVDCISEGWENKRAVFFDARDCTTAKLFKIENFHLEHMPREGALCFRSNGSIVEVDGLFLQHGNRDIPAIWLMTNGNYIFKNVAWWPQDAWVKSSHSPSIVIEHCTKGFYNFGENWRNADRPGEPIYPHYISTAHKLVR
ncbi:MAG: hypothetical protein ABR574_05850 [Cryomorphaceae bacterium]|nr:hypothetical protein [Flavobacteriales bacterium]